MAATLATFLALTSGCGADHPGDEGGSGPAGSAALRSAHTSDRATADRTTSDPATTDRTAADGTTSDGATSDSTTADGATSHRPIADHSNIRTRAIPGIGDRLRRRIPANSRQVVAVYGAGRDSADSMAVLYTKRGSTWERTRSWPAHNGKKGWTADHHEGDRRSPIGVFTLSDAGGVLADLGARLPYTRDASFAAPRYWAKSHWHDFDYVIAIDYNRVEGTPPDDPEPPPGRREGRRHLAAHGSRQRYVGVHQRVQAGHAVPAAHARPSASGGGDGGQDRPGGLAVQEPKP